MKLLFSHTVPDDVSGVRFDRYASDVFVYFPSRNSARKAIKQGALLIDGDMRAPNHTVMPGQIIDLYEYHSHHPGLYRSHVPVVYEDDHMAVLEKKPGMPVNGNRFRTLENSLPVNISQSGLSDALEWPRPVHRLDSATGGLIAVAKTRQALADLGRQFQQRRINKRYRAVVSGRLKGSGIIRKPLDGRDAETFYSSISHYPSIKNGYLTLVDLRPLTGRTHQLRRHMSSTGYPVMGDKLYGRDGEVLLGKGLFLWAVEISLTHPAFGWPLTIRITEPAKFHSLLEREEKRWKKYH